MFSFRSSDLKPCVQCALLAVATSAVGSAPSLSGNGKCIFLVRVPSKATSSLLLGHSTAVHADAEKQHAVASLPRVTPGHAHASLSLRRRRVEWSGPPSSSVSFFPALSNFSAISAPFLPPAPASRSLPPPPLSPRPASHGARPRDPGGAAAATACDGTRHRLRRAGRGGGRRRRHIRRPRQPPRRRQGTPVIPSLPLSLLEKRILSVE